jgi:signal transduction histidine kinase
MSAGPQPISAQTQDQAVLGVLLHSLSQPLTSLRCSLELSVEDVAGQQQDAVSAALEQTDRVIAVVRLMREYLDTESAAVAQPVPVGPVLRGVVDHLSPVAADRQVGLRLMGGCSSTIALPEARLRLAFQYLVGVLVEKQPRHGDITLRLEQGALESELRAHVERVDCGAAVARHDPCIATLHDVQLAIARRLLESAGASLVFGGDDHSGFRLCIPRPPRPISAELFA